MSQHNNEDLVYPNTIYGQLKKVFDNNDVVSVQPLNLKDEDSIRELLYHADSCIQYGENTEPRDDNYNRAEETMAMGSDQPSPFS